MPDFLRVVFNTDPSELGFISSISLQNISFI